MIAGSGGNVGVMAAHAPTGVAEHHHRDIQAGAARAAVFGISDGLVTNVALVLGVAAADPAAGVVRLVGLAGLIGGAFSMAAGEYLSMRVQAELLEAELDMERIEIQRRPENERRELAAIYRNRGVDADTADELATQMMRSPELALETHAREELGIDPASLGSPARASISSFVAFAVGAVIPLLPWLFGHGNAAELATVILGTAAAIAVGALIARFTGKSSLRSALRQLLFAGVPAVLTYAIGNIVGVAVG